MSTTPSASLRMDKPKIKPETNSEIKPVIKAWRPARGTRTMKRRIEIVKGVRVYEERDVGSETVRIQIHVGDRIRNLMLLSIVVCQTIHISEGCSDLVLWRALGMPSRPVSCKLLARYNIPRSISSYPRLLRWVHEMISCGLIKEIRKHQLVVLGGKHKE
ncbi:hypothetical protein S40288_11362 [Stachybotrys chartarum IBT 40288]|nr:hypothetical protein S40288_11362 [Stachybotrys chartarum IBT 40288]